MSAKRVFIILLFSLIVVFGLNQGRSAHAEEATQPITYLFTPVVTDSLYASASGIDGCPDIETDTAHYQYALPVTEGLLADLENAFAAGETPVVKFRTVSSIYAGSGEVYYSARIVLAVEHAGSVLSISNVSQYYYGWKDYQGTEEAFEVNSALDPETGEILWNYIELASVGNLEAGDTLLLGGMAEGSAKVLDCESDDPVRVSWEINGDPDQPIVVGLFIPVGPDWTNNGG